MFKKFLFNFKLNKSFFSYKNLLVYLLIFISTTIFITGIWIKAKFGDVGFEGVVFTMKTPLDGVPTTLIFSYLRRLLISLAVSYIINVLLVVLINKIPKKIYRSILYVLILNLLLLTSIYITLTRFNNLSFYINDNYSDFIENNYVDVDKNLKLNVDHKKNLIFLALESMEGTFVYDNYGLSYMKNLNEISEQNISFRNHIQIFGTTNTVAGFTAQLFGIPLRIPIMSNRYGIFAEFLPNATSVIDLLDNNNYNVAFLLGGDSEFGGKDKIFKSHSSNPLILDSTDYLKEWKNRKYYSKSWWGFKDEFIYEKAKELIVRLSKEDKNFFTLILTVDTHTPGQPHGDYPPVFGDERDAFIQADYRVKEFLSWLKTQPFYEDTVVVIMGDHLFMSRNIGPFKLPTEPRRTVYNVFINTGLEIPKDKQLKTCSSLDMAPTILEALGFNLPDHKFGLGVSLFSDSPTLLELYDENYLNQELNSRSNLYESFF
jgi:phosphoglycerol transferase